jgi:ketosteroid isomerase-like protein
MATVSESDVVAFFERYGAEFDRRNWSEYTSFFHEPCLSVRGDGSVKYFQTRAEVRQFFEAVADTWRGEGYIRFAFSDLEVTPIGSRSLLATLNWQMLRQDGTAVRTWRQSYQLIRVEPKWQVLISTYHAG